MKALKATVLRVYEALSGSENRKAKCRCLLKSPNWEYVDDTSFKSKNCNYVSENPDLFENFH